MPPYDLCSRGGRLKGMVGYRGVYSLSLYIYIYVANDTASTIDYGFPNKGPGMRGFDIFFVVSVDKLWTNSRISVDKLWTNSRIVGDVKP